MKILDRINSWIRNRKAWLVVLVVLTLAVLALSYLPQPGLAQQAQYYSQTYAQSSPGDDKLMQETTSWLLIIITWTVYFIFILANGILSGLLIKLIVGIAGWNVGFTTLPAIANAWEIVLDLTNMLFIIILLVIAFATVFKVETYSYKKLLPTLIIVAVLVNFSRVICGLAIDASQIVMLTFVDAFSNTAGASLSEAFQLNRLFVLDEQSAGKLIKAGSNVLGQYLVATLAAAAMMSVMVLVLFVYLVVLVGRIAVFWIATVLSPLAFVCSILPATKKYYQEWLETFSRYLIIGPLMMFFFWLALYIISSSYGTGGLVESIEGAIDDPRITGAGNPGISKALDPSTVANFIIATLLLMKGMEMAQSLAREFSEYTGKAKGIGEWFAKGGLGREIFNRTIKPAAGAVGIGLSKAWGGAKTVGRATGEMVSDRLYEATGVDVNLKRVWEKMKAERADIKRERELAGRSRARRRAESGSPLAWLGASDYMYRRYLPLLGQEQKGAFGVGAGIKRMRQDKRFNEAIEGRNALKEDQSKLLEKEGEIRGDFENENISSSQKRAVMEEAAAAEKVADSLTPEKFKPQDEKTSAMLSDFLSQLEEEGKSAEASKVRAVRDGVARIDTIRADFAGYLGQKRARLDREAQKNEIEDKDYDSAYQTFLAQANPELAGKLAENKAAIAEQESKMEKLAPALDYAGVAAQRSYMAEELKKIETDNEDDLKSMLRSRVREKDLTGTLATMLQMAKVGHSNEVANAFGLESNAQNVQDIFEGIVSGDQAALERLRAQGYTGGSVGNAGNRDLAMSVADDFSRAAKAVNHWGLSEMVTSEHGRMRFRPRAEQEERRLNEMSKMGYGEVARKGNRLAFGEYRDGRWQFNPSGLAVAGNMLGEKLLDQMRKGIANANWIGHVQQNPAEQAKLRKVMEQQIRSRPGEEAKIRESFRKLMTYVAPTGGQGFDPGAVTASNERVIKAIEKQTEALKKKAA